MKKKLTVILIFFALVFAYDKASAPKDFTYYPPALPTTFDEYYKQQLDTSRAHHATAGNEQKLIRKSAGKTHIALLYIHGYSASRAEGEYVVDSLANLFNANTYYLRLPGHGTSYEELGNTTFREYLSEVITTVKMMHQLGDKVVVVGTSMGGLLATYVAGHYQQDVDGLILCSPFYDYDSRFAKMIKVPGMLSVNKLISGKYRNMTRDTAWIKQTEPGYNDHWYQTQLFDGLRGLEDLRNYASHESNFKRVNVPTLLMYYYKDDKHHDDVASIAAMQRAFESFCTQKTCKTEMAMVADGNHVLTSKYVKGDKGYVIAKMEEFLKLF